jgi:hypothetical protein
MSTQSLLLKDGHHLILLDNAPKGSDIRTALIWALPQLHGYYRVHCIERAMEQLLHLALKCCPDAVSDISKQII